MGTYKLGDGDMQVLYKLKIFYITMFNLKKLALFFLHSCCKKNTSKAKDTSVNLRKVMGSKSLHTHTKKNPLQTIF